MAKANQQNKVVIVLFQRSVIIKTIERKLLDGGYRVALLEDDVGQFYDYQDYAEKNNLFLVYLPSDISHNSLNVKKLAAISEAVTACGRNMILIGEKKSREELENPIPSLNYYQWIYRPLDKNALEDLDAAIETAISGPPQRAKEHILIVDDDPAYAKMIKEWLKDSYQVSIVTLGMQAITFLVKHKVDLILMDYEMPVVDGPQLVQMLRQDPSTAHIPVVFLTGVSDREYVQRVMDLNLELSGYLLKSTPKEDILKYLKKKLSWLHH